MDLTQSRPQYRQATVETKTDAAEDSLIYGFDTYSNANSPDPPIVTTAKSLAGIWHGALGATARADAVRSAGGYKGF
jgi:hypothetical protein